MRSSPPALRAVRRAGLVGLAVACGVTVLAAPAWGQVRGGGVATSVRRDTLALAPGQATAQLPARPIPGTATVEALRDSGFVALPRAGYSIDGRGLLRLAAPADTVVVLAVAYRALVVPGPVRARVPSADSVRALYEPDTSRARAGPPLAAPAPAALQTRGSITRGVVAGSNRDVSVTSALRLSLEGEVSPGVTLRAALTDEDTPILPEGTTQQLSDLDRVYVEVDGPGVAARLGDVDLAFRGTEFAPLTRQVQGALVEAAVPAAGFVTGGRVAASASAVRGRFRSQDLVPIEGVQGPYRLEGAAGEAFVVVVPGSERVYLDGRLLQRGEGADYTVDYGTGEVTFTPNRLVTAERRITVDFEYTAGGLARTLLATGGEVGLWPGAGGDARARLGARLYREADAAASALDLGLTEDDLRRIEEAGDADVLVPGEQRVPFSPESPFVLYTRRDTTVGGEPVRVFVPAQPSDADVFRVRFTRVGPGRGDYQRAGRARNGVLYEYVGPGRGDAVPFRLLPRPAARTLVDVAGEVEPVAGLQLFGEWARSVDDANTLSTIDDADDGAGASLVGLRIRPQGLAALGLGGVVSGEVRRRARADGFRPLDRVRDVEFNRRWNLARAGTPFGSVLDSLGEDVTEGELRWALDEAAAVDVEAGQLALGGFRSRRAAAAVRFGVPGGTSLGGLPTVAASAAFSGTSGTGPVADRLGTGAFREARVEVARPVGAFLPALAVEHERREQRGGALPQDSLLSASYAFVAVRPGVGVTAGGVEAGATVEWRRESEPLGPRGQPAPLADAARVLTVEATARARPGPGAGLDARVAYRRKRYGEPFRLLGREDAESVALRLSARAAPFGGAVAARAVYDALSERSPILQETYVLVGPDLGEFVWRDGEGEPRAGEPDGVAQVDEFFPETTPLEGAYLRTFVPSQELVPTIGVGLGLRLDVRPGGVFPGDGPLARAARAVALRTVVDVREQTRERDVLRVLLLDPGVLQQAGAGPAAGTVNGRFRVEQEATLFPDRPRLGGRLSASHAQTTARLAVGLEARRVQTARAEAYGPLGPAVDVRLEAALERRRTESEAFASRTFDLRGVRLEPSATWTPRPGLAVTLAPAVASRTDALAPPTRPAGALVVRVPVEVRWTRAGRFSASARAERADVRLRGAGGTGLVLFELTEGRGPGTSYLWGVDGQVGLTERLRATLIYDGRAPAGAPVIQTVRLQLSALF